MKTQRFHLFFATIVLLFVALGGGFSEQAQAQEVSGRPVLAEHDFIETVNVPSPFVRSFIRNRVGAGQSFNLTTPVYEVNGQPVGGFQGSLILAILDFEYQYAIKPWIAVRFRAYGGGRLGSDSLALLSDGITMTSGKEFGWVIRLHQWQRTSLALDLNLADQSYTGINISSFAEDIIEGAPATLVRKTPSVRSSAGLRFAWGASSLLGVSINGRGGYGESVDRNEGDVWFANFAGALDFNLSTKSSLPLGVALGHSYDSFPEFGEDIAKGVHTTFVRFSYLGRDDFLVSLDLTRDQIPVSGDRPDIKVVAVTISLKYYL